jgi:enamine deaminase RidA (YjgF/YER057c/UK114 family)
MNKTMLVRVLSVFETYIKVEAENDDDARQKAQEKINVGDYPVNAVTFVREFPKQDWDVEVVN